MGGRINRSDIFNNSNIPRIIVLPKKIEISNYEVLCYYPLLDNINSTVNVEY